MTIKEPTAEECSANAVVDLDDGRTGHACWFPQMGGYAGKAAVVIDQDGHADVYVWHDGAFPFHGDQSLWPDQPPRSPVELHLCDGGQFVAFGQFIESLQNAAEGESDHG